MTRARSSGTAIISQRKRLSPRPWFKMLGFEYVQFGFATSKVSCCRASRLTVSIGICAYLCTAHGNEKTAATCSCLTCFDMLWCCSSVQLTSTYYQVVASPCKMFSFHVRVRVTKTTVNHRGTSAFRSWLAMECSGVRKFYRRTASK